MFNSLKATQQSMVLRGLDPDCLHPSLRLCCLGLCYLQFEATFPHLPQVPSRKGVNLDTHSDCEGRANSKSPSKPPSLALAFFLASSQYSSDPPLLLLDPAG